MATIVVLNDGETFTDVQGCSICWVEDGLETHEIERLVKDLPQSENTGRIERLVRMER